MRCGSCNTDNREGARFCVACGHALAVESQCPRCGAPHPPGQVFCDSCGQHLSGRVAVASAPVVPQARTPDHLITKILAARPSLEGERKQVTVLFVDVKGSVDMTWSIDPEQWRGVMERFFSMMCDGVHRFEGTVDKFTGDGMMAIFGAPVAHEDHAQRACHTALQLLDEIDRYATELAQTHDLEFSVRMGLNSGEVVVGTIGSDLRMTYTALGRTVGLAQRMEQIAEPGKAYVSESTAALVRGYFDLQDLGEIAVKGAPQPMRVFELGGVGALRTSLEISRMRGLSRFVGRSDETALLDDALARTRRGRGQTIAVVADPGVGKSRLTYEFVERCRAQGVAVHTAHAVAYSRAQPFLPVLAILRSYLGIEEKQEAAEARETVVHNLLRQDPDLGPELPLLLDFLGLGDPDERSHRKDPEERERQLVNVVKRVVKASTTQSPTVVVIEDVHWLDRTSEPLLRGIREVTQDTQTMLVVTFRTGFRFDWLPQADYHQIYLRPLGPHATEKLLIDLLGNDPSLDGLPEIVRERTAGNPFFVEELVRSLAEAGTLSGDQGHYRLRRRVDQLTVPATVQAVLAARMDRLPQEAQTVLLTGAVIGRDFPLGVLASVSALPEKRLAHALTTLVDGAFLHEDVEREVVYTFQHPLTREVAYSSQLTEQRQAVHADVARTLAELYPDKLDERSALIAHHWEMAAEVLQAAKWNARAAAWAATRNRIEALRLWEKVRELVGRLPESAETVELEQRARIWWLELGWRVGITEQEATLVFKEGRAVAARNGDLASLAMLLTPYAFLLGQAGKVAEYVELSTEAVAVGDRCGDVRAQLGAYASLTHALFLSGRLSDGLETVERAIAFTGGDPSIRGGLGDVISTLADFTRFRAEFLLNLGRLDEAIPVLDRAADIAAQQSDLEILSWTHATYPWVESYRGTPLDGTAHALEAVRLADEIGGSFLVWAYEGLGLAYLLEQRWTDAIAACERSLEIAGRTGSGLELSPRTLAHLANALLGAGEPEKALRTAEQAVSYARSRNLRLYEITALLALGRVGRARGTPGDVSQAREALQSALTLAIEAGARAVEPLLRWELARMEEATDSERREEIQRVHQLLTANGALGHRARLEQEMAGSVPAIANEPAG
jgi:class 3 adenylate cyclase/tetratricopeptide (TPR) repeat protein